MGQVPCPALECSRIKTVEGLVVKGQGGTAWNQERSQKEAGQWLIPPLPSLNALI